MTDARERRRLVPLRVIPTGRPTPLVNAATEIPPVVTVDVIRPVFTMLVIVLNRFIFWQSFHELQFHQAGIPQLQLIFLGDMFVVLVMQ